MQTESTTSPRSPAWWLFWSAISLIAYTYIGFPLLTTVRGVLRTQPIKYGADTPKVSVIIAAYNEEAVIVAKLDNTMALDYPQEQIEVIVASDGSDDHTNALVAGYAAGNIKLLALPRQGKNRTLNTAVTHATGDILVFTDADSMLDSQALRYLTAPFNDSSVGGVGGDYRYTEAEEGEGERTYWNLDRILKQSQSRSGSMTSATGQIYAMRRSLFRPMPDGVTDDFFTSVQVPAAHSRLVFEPRALAYGPVATTAKAEFRRKVRVMTAGLRGVWQVRQALNPLTHGYFAVQLFSHKVLRRLMVLPLLMIAISAPALWRKGWLYRFVTLGQVALHTAGGLGFMLRSTRVGRNKALSLPFFFEMINLAALVAVRNLIRGERHDIWVPQRTPETSTEISSH